MLVEVVAHLRQIGTKFISIQLIENDLCIVTTDLGNATDLDADIALAAVKVDSKALVKQELTALEAKKVELTAKLAALG